MIARIMIHGDERILQGVMDFGDGVQPTIGWVVWLDSWTARISDITFFPDGDGEVPDMKVQVELVPEDRWDAEEVLEFLEAEPFAALTAVRLGERCLCRVCKNR